MDVATAWCNANGHTLEGFAGGGAFKDTFKAVAPDGLTVALKVYRSAKVSERSAREISAMQRCDSPLIASVWGVSSFDHAGHTFLVSTEKFIEGGTLTDRLRGRLLSRDELLALGDGLIQGLAHLEAHGLVHRDLKPDNIMLDGQSVDRPIIVDFGLVRDLSATSLTQTFLLRGPGTPLFSSPEQLNNAKAMIGWTSDQFSLGVVLVAGLLGRHPFDLKGAGLG